MFHLSIDALRSTILAKCCSHVVSSFRHGRVAGTNVQPMFSKSNLFVSIMRRLGVCFRAKDTQLAFSKTKCLFWHVSFHRALSERRMMVLPLRNRLLDKLKNLASACVIKVISCVILQVIFL